MARSKPAPRTDRLAVHLWRSGESRPEKAQIPHAPLERVLAIAAQGAAVLDIVEIPSPVTYALRTRNGWVTLSRRDFDALRLAPAAIRAVHVQRQLRAIDKTA